MTRYNWILLRDEFLKGDWLSVSSFLKDKGIDNNSRNRSNTRGWTEDKKDYLRQIISKTQEKHIENESDLKLRQQRIAKHMQLVGLKGLKEHNPESVDQARKLVTDGLQFEREILGLNNNHHSTQVNIGIQAKTELDKKLESMDYEQIIQLLAEIKQEKERRTQLAPASVSKQ